MSFSGRELIALSRFHLCKITLWPPSALSAHLCCPWRRRKLRPAWVGWGRSQIGSPWGLKVAEGLLGASPKLMVRNPKVGAVQTAPHPHSRTDMDTQVYKPFRGWADGVDVHPGSRPVPRFPCPLEGTASISALPSGPCPSSSSLSCVCSVFLHLCLPALSLSLRLAPLSPFLSLSLPLSSLGSLFSFPLLPSSR